MFFAPCASGRGSCTLPVILWFHNLVIYRLRKLQKIGFFCRPPEALNDFRYIPWAIRTNTETLLFHRRQWNLKARYGSGLNPKQSKPLFT